MCLITAAIVMHSIEYINFLTFCLLLMDYIKIEVSCLSQVTSLSHL